MNIPPEKDKLYTFRKKTATCRARSFINLSLYYLYFLPFFFISLGSIAVCSTAKAQTVRTIGPFDVSFYNAGDHDADGTTVHRIGPARKSKTLPPALPPGPAV